MSDFTYITHMGSLDEAKVDYACCVCHTPLFFNRQRSFPDWWCNNCYRQFKSSLADDWMKYLVRVENTRRMRLFRRKARGESYEVVSYDKFAEMQSVKDDNDDGYLPERFDGTGYEDDDPDTAADD